MSGGEILVLIGGLLHFGILIASSLVPRVLDWKVELRKVGALTRQLVWVHGIFIVLVILAFGWLSVLLHDDLTAGTTLGRSVCGFIALFWGARLGLQYSLFDPTPHLSNRWLVLGHHGLTLMFLYFTLVYGWFALAPKNLPTLDSGEVLSLLLEAAAVGQAAVGLLNLGLPWMLRWRPALSQLPLLPRQVFYIHSLFISVTLFIFAVLTYRFADSMALGQDRLASWLAAGIGSFWGLRAILQVAYYSPRHWLGRPRETAAHITLLLAYAGMSVVYFLAVSAA